MTLPISTGAFDSMRKRAVLRSIYERDGKHCQHCGVRVRLLYKRRGTLPSDTATLDHIIPRGRDGGDETSNLLLACRRCNQERGCMEIGAFRELLARLGRVPA